MGKIKGQLQYQKFLDGKKLTRGESIKAQCYVCNGMDEGGEDCLGRSCPLYQWFSYRGRKNSRAGKTATLKT